LKKPKILVAFSDIQNGGSPEHYYHFLLGYLLPAGFLIDQMDPNTKKETKFLFLNCGPLMNPRTKEVAAILGIKCRIVPTHYKEKNTHQTVYPERWDHLLSRDPTSEINPQIKRFFEKIQLATKDTVTKKSRVPFCILKQQTRLSHYENCFLILERSKGHFFYSKWGKAKRKGYGKTRRSLRNIDEALLDLRKHNIPVKKFEPGKFSFSEQVQVFQNSLGVIGVRGAELSNILWLPAGSLILMVNLISMDDNSVFKNLAQKLNQNFDEVISDEGSLPQLDSRWVIEKIGLHRNR
jgi:hypothetical protein